MKNVLPSALPLAAISVLSWSCNADLLVGEKDCYGEGIDCDSDAPTLHAIDAIFAGSRGQM